MQKLIKLLYGAMLFGLYRLGRYICVWAAQSLAPVERIEVIPGVFSLSYKQTYSALVRTFTAIGSTNVYVILVAFLAALILICNLENKPLRYMMIGLSLIIIGAMGNLNDLLSVGEIVDYIDFTAILPSMPLLNYSDCLIIAGFFIIIAYVAGIFVKYRMKPRGDFLDYTTTYMNPANFTRRLIKDEDTQKEKSPDKKWWNFKD